MRRLMYKSLLMFVLLAATSQAKVPVTDGLIIHLNAESLNLGHGASVSAWQDQATADSINGTVLTAAGANEPVYKANGYNGLPAVEFDRALTQALSSGEWIWDDTAGVCIIAVATGGLNTADVSQKAIQVGKSGTINNVAVACDLSSYQSGVRYGNGTALTAVGSSPFAAGDWHISIRQVGDEVYYNTLFYAVNNVNLLSMAFYHGTYTTHFEASGNDITLGNGRASGAWRPADFYDGMIAEVLVYNKLLTSTEMQQVMNYLENRLLYSAQSPTPSDDAVDQATQVTFSWQTGLDPNNISVTNPNITGHYFYLVSGDPNFSAVTPDSFAVGTTSVSKTLQMDKTYYWRVDESINGSAANDPNTIRGPVWSFETMKSVPVIDTQPGSTMADQNGTASFDIVVSSLSTPHYAWFKSADGIRNPSIDAPKGSDSPNLTVSNVQITDEGFYYCKVTNAGGESTAVLSDVVRLGIKRKVAHYTLDEADYDLAAELYVDSSGNGHHADPNLPPEEGSFVPANYPAKTVQALNLTLQPLASAWTQAWTPTFGTGQVTVSAWVKWSGLATWTWQGLVNSRGSALDPMGDIRNFLLEIEPSGKLRVNAGGILLISNALPTDKWTHVALTAGPDSFAIYFDGRPIATQTPGAVLPEHVVPLYIGALSRNVTGTINTFNGTIDDVQIFNYAKTQHEIYELYNAVTDSPVCLSPGTFDVSGPNGEPDCLVNLHDFAEVAADLLNCGYYPLEACP